MQIQSQFSNASLRDAWVKFSAAQSYTQYCQRWLELMCIRVDNVEMATLLMETEESGFQPTAIWPEKSEFDADFTALIEEGISEQAGLVHSFFGGKFGVVFPIKLDEVVVGVVALSVKVPKTQLPSVMENLQWGSSWIELLQRRHNDSETKKLYERLSGAVDLLGAVLAEADFHSAAITFVNELASAHQCDRVSFGLVRGTLIEVTALSHSAQFGKKMNLVRRLSGVMDEAVQQRGVINYPNKEQGLLVAREHAQFSQSYANASLLTIPLHSDSQYFGAVTLERTSECPFSQYEEDQIRSIIALSGETLKNKRDSDKTWYQHLASASARQLIRVLGRGYLGRKLLILLITLCVVFFSVFEATYEVSADSVLEGSIRRVVVAPFEGYLESASVKAGERVLAGQQMSRLDERDLILEKLSYLSEQSKLQRQHEEAVADKDRAQAAIIKAQIAQNAAQLNLVESKLSRTKMLAPFDGFVVSGDLSQRLGSALEQGEVLFEVAPLDQYRVILWVDEHKMADVIEGQTGRLILNALPEDIFEFKLTQVTPVTEARDGANLFRVEAALSGPTINLRPGMKGIGKIQIDQRKLIWIWTYPLQQWVRLKVWAWWP